MLPYFYQIFLPQQNILKNTSYINTIKLLKCNTKENKDRILLQL